jgi:ketosteroid isomerase-like protein
MISREFAERFARHWVDAWNRHDLEAVLSHYADDFEMLSPYIARIAGEPAGRLKGKAAVRAYWATALEQLPHLHFELIDTLVGVDSITLYYRGVRGMAAEVFQFDAAGLVVRAAAHYADGKEDAARDDPA